MFGDNLVRLTVGYSPRVRPAIVFATVDSTKKGMKVGAKRREWLAFAALVFVLAQMADVIAPTPATATSHTPWTIAADSKSTIGAVTTSSPMFACSSVRDCTAVGYHYRASNVQTLIERWNGSKWSVTPSPNTSEFLDNDLSGIACISARSCTVVGYHYDGGTRKSR